MAAASNEDDTRPNEHDEVRLQRAASNGEPSTTALDSEEEDDDDDDEDETDEEPKLKYSRLTTSLGPVYRNGDATSTFMVGGDKMVRRIAPAPRPRALTRRRAHAEL
jgi:vacuolar protein sorting-associated protein 41